MSTVRKLRSLGNRKSHGHRNGKHRPGARRALLMESLEDRRLLAVVWDRVEPLGSLIFQADVAGDTGTPVTTAFLEADQTLTVVAKPDDASTTLSATAAATAGTI